MTCDHIATRASFAAFFGATRLIGGQDDGEGGWLLLGVCTGCGSTLGIPIAEPRGNAVHGEVATDEPRSRYHFDAGKTARHLGDLEEMDEHARRVIK